MDFFLFWETYSNFAHTVSSWLRNVLTLHYKQYYKFDIRIKKVPEPRKQIGQPRGTCGFYLSLGFELHHLSYACLCRSQ